MPMAENRDPEITPEPAAIPVPGIPPEPMVIQEPEIRTVIPVLPGPGFWGALGWCLVLVLVSVLLAIPLVIVLIIVGRERGLSLFLLAQELSILVLGLIAAAYVFKIKFRRVLALRRVSLLQLLLVVLLAPPLFILVTEVVNLAEWSSEDMRARQGRAMVPSKDRATAQKGLSEHSVPEVDSRRPVATARLDLMRRLDEELAKQPWLWALVTVSLLPGVGEEIFFRGFLSRGLVARYGVIGGTLLTALIFAVIHIDPVQICATLVLGIALQVVFLTTKSLPAAMLLHTLHNGVVCAALKLGQDASIDLTGQEGAEHLPWLVVVTALVAVVTLGFLLYETQTRWLMPDGREWSPGYVTAEMPAALLGAVPRSRSPRRGTALLGSGAYTVFAATFAWPFFFEHEPKSAWAYNNRGNAYLEKGEFDRAIADYSAAMQLEPTFAWSYCNRGLALAKKGEFRDALPDLNEAIRLDPKLADAYRNRGWAYVELNENDKAIADLVSAIRLGSTDAFTYVTRGRAYHNQEAHDQAITDFNEAIRIDPREASAYANRGLSYSAKGAYDQAIDDWNQALHLDGDAWTYNALAWLRIDCPEPKHRDGKKAVQCATRACELTNWKEAPYLWTLAAAHASCGRLEEAVNWQEKAWQLAPEKDKANYLAQLEFYRAAQLHPQPADPLLKSRPDN